MMAGSMSPFSLLCVGVLHSVVAVSSAITDVLFSLLQVTRLVLPGMVER